VRLPAATLAAAGLHVDMPVEMRVEAGRVVIEQAPEDMGYLEAVSAMLAERDTAKDRAAWATL
jgi:antitoxin component of MazEF toxin-antitoxin module